MKSKISRLGAANFLWLFLGATLLLAVLLVFGLGFQSRKTTENVDKLTLYLAAGIRVPVEQIIADYETEYGVAVEVQPGGSQVLLGQLEVNKNSGADLYLAGDDSYTDMARQKGLAEEVMPIAEMKPVLAVQKGNPKGIQSLDDLLEEGVRVALGNPEQAAVGKAAKTGLEAAGKWAALEAQVTKSGVFKPTVNEVANDVKIGAVDAGIIWNATAAMPEYKGEVDVVEIPALASQSEQVTIAVLTSSDNPTASLRFARYLTARDKGLPVFAEYGFEPVDGDEWAEHPELTFYCGSVNRRAVEDVIKAFEEREGCTVNTAYNGCGILTAQMRTINQEQGGAGFPDVYMACDRYYLENVKDWFQEDADISCADIVIAVAKGNPKNIQGIEDLTKPGMRVAVGQGEQCTIGALTKIMLEKMNVYEAVMNNVLTQTATSALLVPAVVTGGTDAAIAYVTDTQAETDKVDTIHIDSPFAKAIQPFAVAKSSKHKYLGRRLFVKVTEAEERFTSAGFDFLYKADDRYGLGDR